MKNSVSNIENNNGAFLTANTAGFLDGKKHKPLNNGEIIQNEEEIANVIESDIIQVSNSENAIQEPIQIFNTPLVDNNTANVPVAPIESDTQTANDIEITDNTNASSVSTIVGGNNVTSKDIVDTPTLIENNNVVNDNGSIENAETSSDIVDNTTSIEINNTESTVEDNSNQTVELIEKHTIDEFEEAENEFAATPIVPQTPPVDTNTDSVQNNIANQPTAQEVELSNNPSSIFNIPLITAVPVQSNVEEKATDDNPQTDKQATEEVEESSDNPADIKENTEVGTMTTTASLDTSIDYFNFEFNTSQPEKEEIKTELSLDEESMKFDFNSVIREPENKGTLDTPTEKIDLDKFLEPKENLIKKAEEAEENDNNVIRIKEDKESKSHNSRKYLLYGFYVLLLIVAIFFCIKLYKSSINFSLTRTEITLAINSTYQAEVVSNSKIQDNKKYQWSSSNTSVVIVDENGLITSVGDGEAIVFVEKGNNKKELKVTAVAIEIRSITFKEKELALKVGEEKTLQAIINDDETIVIDLVWESSDPNVITVDENGHVVAVGEGTAYIQVYDEVSGLLSELPVTVTPSKDGKKPEQKPVEPDKETEKVEVTGVALNKSDLIMEVDEYVVVSAVVRPANATDKKVTWSSSNKNVATVSSSGKITAKAEGTATITAKTINGKKASIKVTVTKKFVKVTGVSLNKESATLTVGENLTLSATVSPKNATNPKVSWSTSDSSVATVSSSGKVTAKSAGTATITVTTNDGNKKAVCTITVKEKEIIKVTGITLNKETLNLETGETATITATVSPDNATDKSVTWSTSNSNVATVSNGKVTATGVGTATITVTSNDGSKTATCTVTVTAPIINASGVALNETTITLKVGETFNLFATVTPNNTTDKSVTWSSTNNKVASVDNGLVTAKKVGECTITVKTVNNKKATCKVYVVDDSTNEETDN